MKQLVFCSCALVLVTGCGGTGDEMTGEPAAVEQPTPGAQITVEATEPMDSTASLRLGRHCQQ